MDPESDSFIIRSLRGPHIYRGRGQAARQAGQGRKRDLHACTYDFMIMIESESSQASAMHTYSTHQVRNGSQTNYIIFRVKNALNVPV